MTTTERFRSPYSLGFLNQLVETGRIRELRVVDDFTKQGNQLIQLRM